MNKPTWLLDFTRNEYSQDGEDGVIEKIFEVLPEGDKWCVEFGAWDGVYLSNTRHLILSKGFSAILIEADRRKFYELQRNYSQQQDKVIPLNQFVGFSGNDNLDHILTETPIPQNFDFLSIDIDGNDYHVWKYISKYKPKVVLIEYNPTIPTHIRFVQPADPSVNQGASFLSLVELGKEKGYELVSATTFNAIFIRKEYYHLFKLETNDPEILRTNLKYITYLFSTYDGRIFLDGFRGLLWHEMALKESDFQPLPGFLQSCPQNYTFSRRLVFRLYRLFKNPERFKDILKKIFRIRK